MGNAERVNKELKLLKVFDQMSLEQRDDFLKFARRVQNIGDDSELLQQEAANFRAEQAAKAGVEVANG